MCGGEKKLTGGKAGTEGLCSDSFAYSAILYPATSAAAQLGGVFMKMWERILDHDLSFPGAVMPYFQIPKRKWTL